MFKNIIGFDKSSLKAGDVVLIKDSYEEYRDGGLPRMVVAEDDKSDVITVHYGVRSGIYLVSSVDDFKLRLVSGTARIYEFDPSYFTGEFPRMTIDRMTTAFQ